MGQQLDLVLSFLSLDIGLLLFPVFPRPGTPDDRTLHRSEAQTCDVKKWIAQMWQCFPRAIPTLSPYPKWMKWLASRQFGCVDEIA
jgi:hypothetical protein